MADRTTVIHVEYRGSGNAQGISVYFGEAKTTDRRGNATFKHSGEKRSLTLFVNGDKIGERQIGDVYDFFIDKKK